MIKPYYEQDGITIYHGDCRDVLPTLADGSIGLVLTDPPYGRSAGIGDWRSVTRKATKFTDKYTWDEQRPDADILTWIALQNAWVVWGGNYFSDLLGPCVAPLMWHKKQEFNGAEFELAWTKNIKGAADTFWLSRITAYTQEQKLHPTQKPLSLIMWAMKKTTGDDVLDPYMGSGTTLVAAKQLGRRAIGIEIEEKYCEIAVKRLAQSVLPLEVSA